MEINQEEWEARLGADLSRVCRLCLKTCEAFHAIFNSNEPENNHTLSHKIMSCAQVKVFEGDGLPTHVCNSCFGQVERSYQFKLLCERSDCKLRGSIVSMNGSSDTDEVDDSDEVDMTQLTPEVIIDEEPSATLVTQDERPRAVENGDLYNRIMQTVLENTGGNSSAVNNAANQLRQPKYLQGLPGFVHSNQEMARMAVAMAIHQRSVQDQQKKIEEKQRRVDLLIKQQQIMMRQKKAAEEEMSRRCRNGVKAFKCTQCNKSYSFSSALSRHKAVHNPQLRPHFCTICKKGFTNVEKLLRHQRTHAIDSATLFNSSMPYSSKFGSNYLGIPAQGSSSLPLSLMIKPLNSSLDISSNSSKYPFNKSETNNIHNSVNPSLSKILLLKSKMTKELKRTNAINLSSIKSEKLEISIKPETIFPMMDDEQDNFEDDDDDDEPDDNNEINDNISKNNLNNKIDRSKSIDENNCDKDIKNESSSDDSEIDDKKHHDDIKGEIEKASHNIIINY